MTKKSIDNNPGQKDRRLPALTLLEVMVSVCILSIIAVIVFSALVLSERYWKSDMDLLDVHQQARMGIHGMVREIRQHNGSTDIVISADSSRIDFFMIDVANAVKYCLQNDQIIREHPTGNSRVVANNITSLTFCCGQGLSCDINCADAEYVEIQVNATKAAATPIQRTVRFNLTERVQLRNE